MKKIICLIGCLSLGSFSNAALVIGDRFDASITDDAANGI